MEMRGLMGGFYKISEWIMRLAVTNVLWILTSLPTFLLLYVAYAMLALDPKASIVWPLIVAMISAPFFLFPATASMFTVARKWVTGDADVPLVRTFFRGYKENYKQSMLGGLLYSALALIMIVDFNVYLKGATHLQLLSYIFIGLTLLLGVSLFNFFSMIVHYHMKTLHLVKNAVLLTIGRPIRSLSTAAGCAVILYFSARFTFLIPFFSGSLIAILSFFNFYGIYRKLQEQQERANAQEDEEPRAEEADLLSETKEEAALHAQNQENTDARGR